MIFRIEKCMIFVKKMLLTWKIIRTSENHHNIRKIRPFLTEHAAQLLVQALVVSRLDYCNALLAGLPSNTIKPLQMIQNAAARLVFNEPKRTHVTPLFISLHWLPVAARIKFKTLMLAYRTTTGSAPSYFHSLLWIYIPSRSLRSASERRLVVPLQRGSKSLSRTFSFTIPGWWNNLHSNHSNHFFIVTSPQHKCLGEWNSWERAPNSAKNKTVYI